MKQRQDSSPHGIEGNEWSDDEIEILLFTVFVFTIVGIFMLFMFLKRRNPGTPYHTRRGDAYQPVQQRVTDDEFLWHKNNVHPLASKLVDGILPFRHGSAARYKPSPSSSVEKAQLIPILASLFIQHDGDSLPNRGANVVLSLEETSLKQQKTIQILTILGMTYNLFVILCLQDAKEENEISSYRNRLYDMGLPKELLKHHRIVACQSVVGRIAFVRQLRPEAVIDFDEEVKDQLSRFGFRVVIHKQDFLLDRDEH